MPKIFEFLTPTTSPQLRYHMHMRVRKIPDFGQISCYIAETLQNRYVVSMKGEQEVVCAVSNDDIASDLE